MNCLIPKDTFLDGFIRENAEKAKTRAPASCFKAPAGFFIIEVKKTIFEISTKKERKTTLKTEKTEEQKM